MAVIPPLGTSLPPLDKPRFTGTHVVRWMAAQQNWDRIHFDQAFCHDVAQLEGPVINGALKQHWIVQFLQQGLPGAWPWRIDYRFVGPDFVGQKLQVRGAVVASRCLSPHEFVEIDIEVVNLDRDEVTTRGRAVMLHDRAGPVLDALALQAPSEFALPMTESAPDASIPDEVNARLGTRLEERESRYPVDLSRLRLFAEAVMDLAPAHFDPLAPSPWGCVVAPPLFPLHGLEELPGVFALSEDPRAQGREGVNEVGRDLARQFGISAAGGMNAGNRVQVHSLARAGERVQARSTLVGVRRRAGPRGGDMIFFESLNEYRESGGRPLLTERQTSVVRLL